MKILEEIKSMNWEELEAVLKKARRGAKVSCLADCTKSLKLIVAVRKEQLKRFPEKYQVLPEEDWIA